MLKYQAIDNQKEEWVVFIHGMGGSTRTWSRQIEAFSKSYNLLLLDLPGHGQHSNKIIHKVDSEKLHEGIIETMNHLNISSAHFVALSLGTIVTANFAIHHPEYVKSIILGAASLKVSGVYKLAVIAANKFKKLLPYKFLYKFFAWFMLPKRNHKRSRHIFLREVVKLDKKTMFAWIEYLQITRKSEPILAKLDNLKKNILIISGDEDHCFLGGVKKIVSKKKSLQLNIIDKCGHICSIEKWNDFNNMALNFLKVSKI